MSRDTPRRRPGGQRNRHATGDRQHHLRADDRAVSVAVGYVLNLAIATMLFSALLIAGSGMVRSQTRAVTHDELSVVGQQLAAELSDADRLVRAGGAEDLSELELRADLQDRTAAGGYTIEISHDSTENVGTVELRTSAPEIVVSVAFRSETSVEGVTVSGGPVGIGYDESDEELVVESV